MDPAAEVGHVRLKATEFEFCFKAARDNGALKRPNHLCPKCARLQRVFDMLNSVGIYGRMSNTVKLHQQTQTGIDRG